MKRLFSFVAVLLACVAMFGCAHPITMNPDMAALNAAGTTRIDRQVGYHISDASKALEVTTPGGGGDKVRYFPYRDIEPGFYKALSEVFSGVSKIQNPKDPAAVKASGVSLVITPEISTTSFSDSLVTWPPTQFTVTLVCTVTDPQGKLVQTVRVSGDGRATFREFANNFSLAAVRATNDALGKLMKALAESPELRK